MPVNVFFVPQVVNLVVPESAMGEKAVLHNYPLNRTDFRIIRGVDNLVQFFIRDIDRKANLISDVVQIVITDQFGKNVLLTKLLTVQLASQALYQTMITASETLDLPPGMLRYSTVVERPDQSRYMLWTDRNYSPFGYCDVLEGPYPPPVEPAVLDTFTPMDSNWFTTSALLGTDTIGGVQTFAFPTVNFVGKVLIEGSLEPQPSQADADWFELKSYTFVQSTTQQDGWTVADRVLWLRVRYQPDPMNTGTVGPFTYRR